MSDAEFLAAVGRRIKAAREAKEITRDALARRAFIDPTTLGSYECGKHSPNLAALVRIAGLLEVTAAFLLGEGACDGH